MGNRIAKGSSRALRARCVLEGVALLVALAGAAALGCSSEEEDDDDAAAGEGGSGASGGAAAGGTSAMNGGKSSGAGKGSGTGGNAGRNGTSGSSGSGQSGSGTSGGSDGQGGGDDGGTSSSKAGSTGNAGTSSGTSTAADAARKLGRAPNFMFGMGNDLNNDHNQDGAYTLGVTLDLHYAYLVGFEGSGGWPDWNPGGYFVNILADSADAHGVTPMYDIYSMAQRGEANLNPLDDPAFMQQYWDTLLLLYTRLADFDKPAVVHFEPDFWAFAQQQSGGDPSGVPARVGSLVPDCEGEPEDLAGLGHCMIVLGRLHAPKVLLGFHASRWAGSVEDTVAFLNAIGGGESDFIGMDMLDRDAGCFEAHTDPNCQRNDGPWYWDESNQTSPNFHEYIDWSKQIGDGLGVPPLWWQIPFGVPSDEPGGEAGHYRDNRVRYIFSHVQEFIDAGGLGAVFGVGAGNQTYIDSDGDQFKNAVTDYYASPVPLP